MRLALSRAVLSPHRQPVSTTTRCFSELQTGATVCQVDLRALPSSPNERETAIAEGLSIHFVHRRAPSLQDPPHHDAGDSAELDVVGRMMATGLLAWCMRSRPTLPTISWVRVFWPRDPTMIRFCVFFVCDLRQCEARVGVLDEHAAIGDARVVECRAPLVEVLHRGRAGCTGLGRVDDDDFGRGVACELHGPARRFSCAGGAVGADNDSAKCHVALLLERMARRRREHL